jgi:hypothetical protein
VQESILHPCFIFVNDLMIYMMKLIIFVNCLTLFFVFPVLYAQQWHRIYLPNKPTATSAVFESYDKGYILGGDFRSSSIPTNGLIIKTDINGEMLWYKTVSSSNDFTRIIDINTTDQQGFIMTGVTGEQTEWLNPFIMKLDPCAEYQWCRIFNLPNENDEWGQSIWQIPGGYIALFLAYGEDPENERIWLFRLDDQGDLIWKQVYAQSDTAVIGENGVRMCVTEDYHFIINGFCYYPNPGIPWPKFLRPFIIKTDSTGTLEWEIPWWSVNGENFKGESYNSITDYQRTIYSSGRHIVSGGSNPGDKPCMIKTDVNGNELSYTDFFPDSEMGTTHTINWLVDSTIALGYAWTDTFSYYGTVGVVKCDRYGNILKTKPMFVSQHLFSDAVTTFDNKLLLVGGFWDGIWRSHAYKLNSDLEYDTLYSYPFVYDSLCPYPITSDTIPLDCEVVGLDEPFTNAETGWLKVYPNPAGDILHIEIPEKLKTETSTPAFNITTVYHQWKSATVEVYDLFGRRVFSKEVTPADKELCIDVSSWHAGMYVVRLVYLGRTAGSEKVVVE